jgi:hypothetical protein
MRPPAPRSATGSRAGNRRLNHLLYIAAVCQIRHDTPGRAYYRRKLAEGKTTLEALRCCAGDCPMWSTGNSSPTPQAQTPQARPPSGASPTPGADLLSEGMRAEAVVALPNTCIASETRH